MSQKKYPFNDWGTHPEEKKLEALIERLRHIACTEFGVDQDGDPAVEVHVWDRTRFEKSHYWHVPYDHMAKSSEEKAEVEYCLMFNLQMALQAYDTFLRRERPRRVGDINRTLNREEIALIKLYRSSPEASARIGELAEGLRKEKPRGE